MKRLCLLLAFAALLMGASFPRWRHISSATGDLPVPNAAPEPTASLVLDVDQNGVDDFAIGSRNAGPAVVLYRNERGKWIRYIVEPGMFRIEAGGAAHDVDGDGDIDLIFGGDAGSNEIWWWENPHPHFDPATPWKRHIIKNSGGRKHHDQIVGDFDGDGRADLVSWSQRDDKALLLFKIPKNPRESGPWTSHVIYRWTEGEEHEGLAAADLDGDGKLDLVGGGRWFKHTGGTNFEPHVIDDSYRFSRALAGDFIKGGRPEVVFGPGDNDRRLRLYEWKANAWHGRDLLPFDVIHGHTLRMGDVNRDGHLDIYVAEMAQWTREVNHPKARGWILYGDGKGKFREQVVHSGQGNHEGRLGDFDGDGDLDVLGKPFRHNAPRLDIWINQSGRGR